MAEFDESQKKKKVLRKITPQRLKNIGLYYLKRFESSVENLRQVLQKRVNDYARQTPDFDKAQAYRWIEDILADFERLNYLNDERYTRLKVQNYIAAGKPERYIKIKLRQKGIKEDIVSAQIENEEYNPKEMALKLAKKRKIGPFRQDEESQKLNRSKDLAVLVRAGFDYDVAVEIIGGQYFEEEQDF